jgi:FAD/FMN-containing dehydrogenase/Fe-S oxidoreductase
MLKLRGGNPGPPGTFSMLLKTYPPDLAGQIRKEVEGEVRFDAYSKVLYSTDASLWQMEPIGVVIPKHTEDVLALGSVAARLKVPLLPRGGASSLSGQTVGHAVHIDFAKYMNRILECNTEEGWVRVQPGVVQDQLARHLNPLGFQFGPNTSSSSRATIGGMIGNNSAGSHSILHGKTIDHVIELKAMLADGSAVVFRPVENGALEGLSRKDGLEGRLYRELLQLGESYRDRILERFPKLIRRVSGYNLDELVRNGDAFGAGYSSRPGPFNLAKVVTGSEGTLMVVTEAKVRIVPLPAHKGLLLVHFHSLFDAVDSAEEIVATSPAAAELIDEFILNAARAKPDVAAKLQFVDPTAEALMVVEYYGESDAEVQSKLEALRQRLTRNKMGFGYTVVMDAARQKDIWTVRKESLGLLMSVIGDSKPVAFVEDPAVPIEKMPAFLRGFREILDRHKSRGGYYGHASVGCLHVRPMIDMKTAGGVAKMAAISEEVFQLVQQYGGSMSGEHGDGIARSVYNKRLFGPEIYEAFLKLKAIFDPENIMNPGKVVEPPELTDNLRWGPDYKTLEVNTHLDFSRQGGFARAIEMCNGAGVCRKREVGTMCPSYHATMDEEHSTRGRANALRAALSGTLPAGEFTSRRMYEVLDLCLECKGCKRECPSNVDLAKIKYEFLAQYYQQHGTPLRARLFARVADLNKWGCRFAPLANFTLRAAPVKWLFDRLFGIDRRRQMPPFAPETFESWFRKRSRKGTAASGSSQRHAGGPPQPRPQVVLFHDCFMNYNYPRTGQAATELLEAAGFEVILADKQCCGRPMISKGLIEEARALARENVAALGPYVEKGIPVLGCEPSCLLTLRDEYLDLLQGTAVEKLASGSWMVDEFLVNQNREGKLNLAFQEQKKKVLFHGHCHQKAHIGSAPSLQALQLVPGLQVSEANSGCCGMAGSFGFEKEHYDISEKIGAERLFPAVENASADTEVAVTGVSCRQQIDHFTSRKPRHVVEVLRDALPR